MRTREQYGDEVHPMPFQIQIADDLLIDQDLV